MSDDLSEETLVNGEAPNSSTPKKDSIASTSSWRLTNGNSVVNKSSVSGDPFWSDEDDDEKTDRESRTENGNEKNNSQNSVEDGFESFSCTDEEDEGDRLSLDSNSTSR